MVGLLDHIGTSIEITAFGDPSPTVLTGDIKSWSMEGFERSITSKPTFGTRFNTFGVRNKGTVSFNVKCKNYVIGSTVPTGFAFDVSDGYMKLDESADITKYKIVIKWTTGPNTYIKAFYNAYGIKMSSSGDSKELPTMSVEFMVPPFSDVGSSNYYESTNLSHETTWDTIMGW